MTDRITKVIDKLTAKQRAVIVQVLQRIHEGKLKGLDVVKLQGRTDVFRIRKGNIRIIFQRHADGHMFVLAVEQRSESTYREY